MIIHKKKFKSQDRAGLTATMEAISPHELLDLLESKDYCGVIDREGSAIFTKAEMNQLLDRSDLSWEKLANKENSKKKPTKKSQRELFSVVDTEGTQNMMGSIRN